MALVMALPLALPLFLCLQSKVPLFFLCKRRRT